MKVRKSFLTVAAVVIFAISVIGGVAAPKTVEAVTHGIVASADANQLTLTAKKGVAPEMFKLDQSTAKTGDLASGAKVTVHYKMDNGDKVATQVVASGAKAAKN